MSVDKLLRALDKATAELLGGGQETGNNPRQHLGPSVAGKRCARQVWYGFRWVRRSNHGGRLLRLFERGHEEEHRAVRWLRALEGVEVYDYEKRLWYHEGSDSYVLTEWDASELDLFNEPLDDVSEDPVHIRRAAARNQGPRQWGFSDGLWFSGSSDGLVSGLERFLPMAKGRGLFECKTHSEKSFKQVQSKGVLSSKPEHYNQMQIYMRYLKVGWALYFAVNKNNDEIYVEVVPYKEEVAEFYIDRSKKIIEARTAPPKISNDKSWFECKYCDFREICHYDAEPQRNCRSCANGMADGEGWYCNRWSQYPPADFIAKGCDDWEPVG